MDSKLVIVHYHHGTAVKNGKFSFFFGNRFCDLQGIQKLYPHKKLSLNQVHGDNIVEQKSGYVDELEGDAHFTDISELALIIKTADCMPIFIYDETKNRILAIHAGWRGIENQIVIKAIQKAFENSHSLNVIIGPYIHPFSFEVEQDVLSKLIKKVETQSAQSMYEANHDGIKFKVELKKILIHHLIRAFPKIKFELHDLNIDTMTNHDFHSFRRDKEKSGRNFSLGFIQN